MTVSLARFHSEWPRLLDTSGTFLTLPVLKRAFADGLEPVQRDDVARLREELALFRQDAERQSAFIRFVLSDLLGYGQVLRDGPSIPLGLAHPVPEHGVTLRPDVAVVEPTGDTPRARVLVSVWPVGTDPIRRVPQDGWSASPVDRMAILLRASSSACLGLVTDGLRWVLVSTVTPVTTTAVFDADIWMEERETLDAFVTLLRAKRLFSVPKGERLEDLFEESAGAQEEVTGKLGEQVRQAVELLVAAFSRADREVGGRLLAEVSDEDVYAAAVSVMMRLVFLLYAEERRLFPLDDDLYQASYAASSLFDQLEEEARGEVEVLDRRSAAWGRLLALFRAIHDGIQHEDLRLPAYGGSLFDPDRYPFLEGRPTAATPLHQALPLRVTDLEVRDVMQALQVLRFSARGVTEARRLSYRNLDVEQIGHVYEGLLDHGAMRVDDVHLGLDGKNAPEVALADLEERRALGETDFRGWVAEVAGLTAKQVDRALDTTADELAVRRLRVACDSEDALTGRIAPFLGLVRGAARDLPTVFLPGSIYVTKSSERRSSGTYYTPRSLAEEMVQHALEPLVYSPGPQDTDDRSEWRLRTAAEILDLKVCDMTMGSGAFLVAAIRFLGDRLLETSAAGGDGIQRRFDEDADEVVEARRLVVERCIYGVDRNPMAVEMAKLSMWLVTLSKDRAFTFLDGQLVCGDSLLGVSALDQVSAFHLDPLRGRELHDGRLFDDLAALQRIVAEATSLREELTATRVLDVRDAARKRSLLTRYQTAVQAVRVVADLIVGAALSTATGLGIAFDNRLTATSTELNAALREKDVGCRGDRLGVLRNRAFTWLNAGRPVSTPPRVPLHWPIEFPEVFQQGRGCFDVVVGNPPFLGGTKISGPYGLDYRAYIAQHIARRKTDRSDLVVFFLLRGAQIASGLALLATNTVAETRSSEIGLDELMRQGWCIYRATRSTPWPGAANISVSKLWSTVRRWSGRVTLDGTQVQRIGGSLVSEEAAEGRPLALLTNKGKCVLGTKSSHRGFIISAEEAYELLGSDDSAYEVVKPYLSGEDLASRPGGSPSRWCVYLGDLDLDAARLRYPSCVLFIERAVKPDRDRIVDDVRGLRAFWWRFERPCVNVISVLASQETALAAPRVAKYPMPSFLPSDFVPSDKCVVFLDNSYGCFAQLVASPHQSWMLRHGGKLETRPVYDPRTCYDTFPFLENVSALGSLGKDLWEARKELQVSRDIGMTRTYNLFHDPSCADGDVSALRELHAELDRAVLACYGWDDIETHHAFVESTSGLNYTMTPAATAEVLRRLLALNHERAAAEASQAPLRSQPRARRGRSSRASADRPVTMRHRQTAGVEGTLPLDVEGTLPL